MSNLIEALSESIDVAGVGALNSEQLKGILNLIVSLMKRYDEKHASRNEERNGAVSYNSAFFLLENSHS